MIIYIVIIELLHKDFALSPLCFLKKLFYHLLMLHVV